MAVYLITGVNKGLGAGFVKQIVSNPENLVIGTVRNEAIAKSVEKLGYKNLKLLVLDVSQPYAEFQKVFKKIDEYSPKGIDYLIANAGVTGTDFLGPVSDYNPDKFEDVFNVNYGGATKTYTAAYPYLFKTKTIEHKKIVFLSSMVASTGGDFPFPLANAYGASKAAVNHFGKQVSLENKASDNAIVKSSVTLLLNPGVVDTEMSSPLKGKIDDSIFLSADTSAEKLLKITEESGVEQSGKFYGPEGEEIPW